MVFHPSRYKRGSAPLIENFQQGRYFGVPVLQSLGVTYAAAQAPAHQVAPCPHMVAWLRTSDP